MSRTNKTLITLLIIVTVCCILAFVAAAVFFRRVNNGVTEVTFNISGRVDKVEVYYGIEPRWLVTSIETQGADTSMLVTLKDSQGSGLWQLEPTQYYFVIYRGGQTYQSDSFCCKVGLQSQPFKRVVTIRDLNSWEVTEQP